MDDMSPVAQARSPFRAVLSPHRSLSPAGFQALIIGLSLVSLAPGIVFLLMGAWPVLGLFGLDVLLIYLAFRLSYRSGRLREMVEICPDVLTVTRVHPSGRSEAHGFTTAWVRIELTEGRDGRTELSLRHHGRRLVFARFLTDDERRDLASAMTGALIAARGGPRI